MAQRSVERPITGASAAIPVFRHGGAFPAGYFGAAEREGRFVLCSRTILDGLTEAGYLHCMGRGSGQGHDGDASLRGPAHSPASPNTDGILDPAAILFGGAHIERSLPPEPILKSEDDGAGGRVHWRVETHAAGVQYEYWGRLPFDDLSEAVEEGRLHRRPGAGPTVTASVPTDGDSDGQAPGGQEDREIIGQYWLVDGKLHREDGPAILHDEGDTTQSYWVQDGLPHRGDGPAFVFEDDDEIIEQRWFRHGKPGRPDAGPDVERIEVRGLDPLQVSEWHDGDGELHREDGPAQIRKSMSGKTEQTWYRHGVIHDDDGPVGHP